MPHPRQTVLLQQSAGLTCAAFCFHALLALFSRAPVSENPIAAALVTAVNSGGVWLLWLYIFVYVILPAATVLCKK